MRVIQGIIIHDVISWPKIVLDQLREGLNVLGFGAKMAEYPELFEKLFVPNSESTLSATRVVDLLQFPANMSEADTNYLERVLFLSIISRINISSSILGFCCCYMNVWRCVSHSGEYCNWHLFLLYTHSYFCNPGLLRLNLMCEVQLT